RSARLRPRGWRRARRRRAPGGEHMARLVIGAIVVALLVLSQTVFVVGEWQQAVITQFGKPVRTIREPGLYVKVPVVQTLSRFERRSLATDVPAAEYLTLDKHRLAAADVSPPAIRHPPGS